MTLLADLFQKWSAPRGSGTGTGTDKGTMHPYTATYERLCGDIRHSVTNVLELGVDSGASLAVWADYFPQADIDGLDITLANWHLGRDRSRIRAVEGDALRPPPELLDKTYDVIIDDGSHRPTDQAAAIEVWGPRLAPEGLLIIEDVNATVYPRVLWLLETTARRMGLEYEVIDLRAPGGLDDDVMVVCRRSLNSNVSHVLYV